MRRWMVIAAGCLSVMCTIAQPEVHIAQYYGNRDAALTFTFDDGLQEHYTEVFPRLKSLGIKASFGIIGSKIGRNHKGTPCMTWEQLREMADDGQEITSHGFRHQSLEKLSGEALRYEVQHNDTLIYNKVGAFPRTYFYPGNRKTPEGVAFCSLDRVGTRIRQDSFGGRRDSAWAACWLDRLLKHGDWGIMMTHGITIGYDCMTDTNFFWNHFRQVAGMQDRIWVATFHDIAAYVAERDTIALDIQHSKGIMTVTPRNPLDKKLFFQPLTLVVCDEVAEARQGKQKLPLTHKEGKTLFDIDPNGGEITVKL